MDTSTASTDERAEHTEQIMRCFKSVYLGAFNERNLGAERTKKMRKKLEQMEQRLTKYPDALIKSLQQACFHGTVRRAMEIYALISNGSHNASTIDEYLAFRPHLSDNTEISDTVAILRGLRHYRQLPRMDSYGEAPDSVQEQIVALIKSAGTIINVDSFQTDQPRNPLVRESGAVMLKEDDLIELVMARPSEAVRIAEIVIERDTHDAELIAAVLDTASPSLSTGVL
jgi:hypothetical protein